MRRPSRPCMHAIMTQHGLVHKGFHISLLSLMDMYKRKFWLHQEHPNLAYADVNLNFACTQGHALSPCVYYDLYEWHSINRNFNVRVSLGNSLSILKTIIITEICSQPFCQQQQQAKGFSFAESNCEKTFPLFYVTNLKF